MRRREFISLLGGAAAWSLTAHAQQSDQIRRIGVLLNTTADEPIGQAGVTVLQQALQQLGWTEGRNMKIEMRWGANDVERDRRYATELVGLAPDVILAAGTLSVAALQRSTHTVPIVFVRVTDPVGAGFVDSLARPGGNITGFMLYEYSLSAKWLEFLKQIVPQLKRVAVVRDPSNPAATGQFSVIQATAQPLGVEVNPISIHDASQIERAIAVFGQSPNGGLIVAPSAENSKTRNLIISLAARHKLPAIYGDRFHVTIGGLISYGPDRVDQFRLAAGYIDKILHGEKPADLPVQVPTKYQLTINLKTAKALGLTIPASLLATADEVIE